MESEITIELEQSFASVVRYIQNKADNKAALYFDDLPEAFAVPSLYFPVPRTDTKKVTFSTYLTTLYLDTWFMEATDWQAYADAATVRDSLMMDECKVNLMKKDGTLDDKYIRLTDPSTSPVDTGIVKMTCAIKHYYCWLGCAAIIFRIGRRAEPCRCKWNGTGTGFGHGHRLLICFWNAGSGFGVFRRYACICTGKQQHFRSAAWRSLPKQCGKLKCSRTGRRNGNFHVGSNGKPRL